jgi:hypothetical protein
MNRAKMSGAKSKLGQSANNAAIVVIIIAVLIILYILFLPPEERAALLGEDINNGGGGSGGAVKSVLMSKSPGRIFPSGKNMIEHTMPSFIVFTVTNANELKTVDSLYVKTSVFSNNKGEVIFFYDPKTTEDVKLGFNVKSHSGRLKIMLNDNIVFEGEVTEGSPNPIGLPKEFLKAKNTLVFEASQPGAAFWRVNEYSLDSILVAGKVTDYSAASSEQHFSISDNEFQTLEKAQLEFLPDCPPREGGQVQILLNSRQIYSSFPDCGIKTTVEISKEFLKSGDNVLLASTSTGSFLMDAPVLTTFLKDASQPVFYFNVPAQLLNALYSGQNGLMLTVRFADASKIKRGLVEINTFRVAFDTQDYLFQAPVDPESIFEGSNAIRIIPNSDAIDVAELRIDVI